MNLISPFSPGSRNTFLAIILGITLTNCTPLNSQPSQQWETYYNQRFGFKFPYPREWKPGNPPSNGDGQVFINPQEPLVQIRGWGGYKPSLFSPPNSSAKVTPNPLKLNFKTHQGLPGELKVEIGPEISSMTLTLIQGDRQYSCQGQAPSPLFDHYYKFFYYIMGEYEINSP